MKGRIDDLTTLVEASPSPDMQGGGGFGNHRSDTPITAVTPGSAGVVDGDSDRDDSPLPDLRELIRGIRAKRERSY